LRVLRKEEILNSIKIVEIATRNGVGCEQVSSGNFTHRCKCPGKDHKSGLERTGSLYIDNDNNNFYCFGCGASNNVIDFYILCADVDFSTAIRDLSEMIDPKDIAVTPQAKRQTNFSKILEVSSLFRAAQRAHSDDLEWIERLMRKTDSYIESIDRYDIRGASNIFRGVRRALNRRYSKK